MVRRRLAGVSVNGVPLKIGHLCLFRRETNSTVLLLGEVGMMYYGTDDMDDEFVIFQMEKRGITTYMGHYCLYSIANSGTVLVMWKQMAWRCKALTSPAGHPLALPFASCTTEELMQFE